MNIGYLFVEAVDRGAVRDEQLDDLDVADVACPVDGSPLLLVVHVGVRAVLEEQRYHLSSSKHRNSPFRDRKRKKKKKTEEMRETFLFPLKAACVRGERPWRSDKSTLFACLRIRRAQSSESYMAHMWSAHSQCLSRAFTSALCSSSIDTASLLSPRSMLIH